MGIFTGMNFTSEEQNETLNVQDVFTGAAGRNVFVAVLCISINYINATIVHTFSKHHVRGCVSSQVKRGRLSVCRRRWRL